MDPGKLLVCRAGQVRHRGQAGSCDGAEAGTEPLGPFRVVRAAVVGLGGGVGVDDRLQRFLPCKSAPRRKAPRRGRGIFSPYADTDRRLGRWRDPR